MSGYWVPTSQPEPPTSVPFNNVANNAFAPCSNCGWGPSHIAPNNHRGFAHEFAGRGADMSERLMGPTISTNVTDNDTNPLQYGLRDFVGVDGEVGFPSWLKTFGSYQMAIKEILENSLDQPAYDESLMNLGLVDRIGTFGNRAAATKRPYPAQHRLILQLVEEVKRLKQNSERSEMRERLLIRENEGISEELKAARSMHKNLVRPSHENGRAKITERFLERENEVIREELKEARSMSKEELQRMYENSRVKIWNFADQRISLKLEMAELRAWSDKAVMDSGNYEVIQLCMKNLQERTTKARIAIGGRKATSNETPRETHDRKHETLSELLHETLFELRQEERSLATLQQRLWNIALYTGQNTYPASGNAISGAPQSVQQHLNCPPANLLRQSSLSFPRY